MDPKRIFSAKKVVAPRNVGMFAPNNQRPFHASACASGAQACQKGGFFSKICIGYGRLHLTFHIHKAEGQGTHSAGRGSNTAAVRKTVRGFNAELEILQKWQIYRYP